MSGLPDFSQARSLRDAADAYASDDDQTEHREWMKEKERLEDEYFFKLTKDDPKREDAKYVKASQILNVYQSTSSPRFRALIKQLQSGKAIAFGRLEKKSSDITRIPSGYWEEEAQLPYCDEDYAYWPGPPERRAYNIRIVKETDINKIKNPRNAGRPRTHEWDKAIDQLLVYVATNGKPKTKNDMLKFIENVFMDMGKDIQESSITTHLSNNLPNFFGMYERKPKK